METTTVPPSAESLYPYPKNSFTAPGCDVMSLTIFGTENRGIIHLIRRPAIWAEISQIKTNHMKTRQASDEPFSGLHHQTILPSAPLR